MLALAQGRLWQGGAGANGASAAPLPAPSYANAALGEGPLGVEDQQNFHP
jgi:hypothetical protein